MASQVTAAWRAGIPASTSAGRATDPGKKHALARRPTAPVLENAVIVPSRDIEAACHENQEAEAHPISGDERKPK